MFSSWNVAPSSLVEVRRRFGDACRLKHLADRPDKGSSKNLENYQTSRCNAPEDGRFHPRRRENLKSHLFCKYSELHHRYISSYMVNKRRIQDKM
jgi:hypothetical protein